MCKDKNMGCYFFKKSNPETQKECIKIIKYTLLSQKYLIRCYCSRNYKLGDGFKFKLNLWLIQIIQPLFIKTPQNLDLVLSMTTSIFPPDQLRLIVCLFTAIPVSYILSTLRNSQLILIISCTLSIIMQLIVFGDEVPILWLQQNIVYLICKFGPRKKVGTIVLVETFAALIITQIRRMYLSYGAQNVDITAIFMMQVFMYVGFAYNYQDGAEGNKNTTERTIYKLPDYVQYMGFVLFLPSCLVGPVFEFNDYINYLYRKGIYKEIKSGFTIPAMVKELKTFVICLIIMLALKPFDLSYMLTPEFAEANFFYQSAYLLISIVSVRFVYYSAWSLGLIAVNATGLTYNPIKKEDGTVENNWDRIVVSNIWTFEMDPSMKMKADGWNIPVQLALKRYIYDRTYIPSDTHTSRQKKKLQIMAQQKTLAVSALWHGLYPGYFVSFFHWGLILQVSQELYRIEKNSPKVAYWRKKLYYVELIFINYILGYFGSCFKFMSWQKILILFKATHFIPVITVYILNIVIVRMALFSKSPKKQSPKQMATTTSQTSKQEKVQ